MKQWATRWITGDAFRYSPYQFAVFRIILGVYLAWHFARLVPYGTELFSSAGVLSDAAMTPTWGLFPNVLFVADWPAAVAGFLVTLTLVALAFAAGIGRRITALLLWYGWACLLSRQPFIANPGIPYIGLLLLLCAALPCGEPWKVTFGRTPKTPPSDWAMPWFVYLGVWVLLALGYSVSGFHKLESPSWPEGTAIRWLIDNPLARDTYLRQVLLSMPDWVIAMKTWSALSIELLFAPLALVAPTRKVAWLLMVLVHLGILAIVDFADLTVGMLMVHLFTFDSRWLPAKENMQPTIVFYDGLCGLCDGFVQFCLEEDTKHVLRFATLQGALAKETLGSEVAALALETIAVRTTDGRTLERSAAVLYVLRQLGGMWRVFGVAGRVFPGPVRDLVYRGVAKNRYRIFGKLDACRIPTPAERAQFLD